MSSDPDQWVHDHLFTPLFTWLQRVWHINRYRMIRWMIRIHSGNFFTLLLWTWTSVHLPQILSVLGYTFLVFAFCTFCAQEILLGPELEEASQTHERGEHVVLSEILLYAALRRRRSRGFWTGAAIMWSILVAFDAWEGVLSILDCLLWLTHFSMCTEHHLWSVDDVPPKDRFHLFSPKGQEA